MKRAWIVVLAALSLAGCRSEKDVYVAPPDRSTTEHDAEVRLSRGLGAKIGGDFGGAALPAILHELTRQADTSFALDARLCTAHVPASFSLHDARLEEALDELKRACPDLRIELWRGVVFGTLADDPLPIPPRPLLRGAAEELEVTCCFVDSRLSLAAEMLAGYPSAFQPGASVELGADPPEIAERRVTATLRCLPLRAVLEVMCRLTETRFLPRPKPFFEGKYVNTFEPYEPFVATEQDRRKS